MKILFGVSLILGIIFRILWHIYPGNLLLCSMLFLSAFPIVFAGFHLHSKVGFSIIGLGTLLNAIVVLANGGFMPTSGEATNIWMGPGKLNFLGDFYLGFSPGDILLIVGIILWFSLRRKHTKQIGI